MHASQTLPQLIMWLILWVIRLWWLFTKKCVFLTTCTFNILPWFIISFIHSNSSVYIVGVASYLRICHIREYGSNIREQRNSVCKYDKQAVMLYLRIQQPAATTKSQCLTSLLFPSAAAVCLRHRLKASGLKVKSRLFYAYLIYESSHTQITGSD